MPNPGEAIEMPVLVRNWGTQAALSVVGTLSIPGGDPYITITGATQSFGDVPAGDSVWTPDDFQFAVSPDCPHAYVISFHLALTASNGSWSSDFTVLVSGLTVTLVPDQTSVPRGGTLGLTATVQNHTSSRITTQGWSDVTLPGGQPYSRNPILGPMSVSVRGQETATQRFTHTVPTNAFLGDYEYCGKVGTHPGTVYDEDCFTVTVTP